MKLIPTLNIGQFELDESLKDFYSNDLKKHLKKNKNFFHKPHKHDFFLCVIFTEGSGIHEIDFNTYSVKPGSVFFLMPGQTHYWKFENPPDGYIFFHSQDFYEFNFSNKRLSQFPFYYSYKNPPNLYLPIEKRIQIAQLFEEINIEFNQRLVFSNQKIANLVNLIYIDLSRLYMTSKPFENATSSIYLQNLEALENLIEEFYKTKKLASFYAEKLHMSTKHLNRITKTTLNKTTTDLITERILLEAKRAIVHSENSLPEIAEDLGYEDYAYFSRVFKLRTVKTPLGFKNKYRLLLR